MLQALLGGWLLLPGASRSEAQPLPQGSASSRLGPAVVAGQPTRPSAEELTEPAPLTAREPDHLPIRLLPGPRRSEELLQLAVSAAANAIPIRATVWHQAGIISPVSTDRRGWAVWVRSSDTAPQLVAPLSFVVGAQELRVDDPAGSGGGGCSLQVVRHDAHLGLVRLAFAQPAASRGGAGCRTAPVPRGMQLLPWRDGLPGSGKPETLPLEIFLLPLANDPVRNVLPAALLGPGPEEEAFYLLHDAPWAASAPLIDDRGKLVALTSGPSLLRPGAGLAIGSRAVAEFLSGRGMDGHLPRTPVGQGPSWPPASPLLP